MNFRDIPQMPSARYEVHVEWASIENVISGWREDGNEVIEDPDFQRVHVWTVEQKQAFVEYMLRGGEVGRNITWNCALWPSSGAPIEIVDGKQRLSAVRSWLRGEFPTFGLFFHQFQGSLRAVSGAHFKFRVCALEKRADILRLYLNINAGGTPHTPEELERVRKMLQNIEASP